MTLTVARAIRGEDDTVVSAVDGSDVVIVGGLVGNLRDDWDLVRGEIGDFVKLPVIALVIVLFGWRADDHAENGFPAVPMDAWLTHGDTVRMLGGVETVAGGTG